MRFTATLAATMLFVGCQTLPPKSANPKQETARTMDRVGESFANLLEITADPVRFNQPGYEVMIDGELTRLSQLMSNPVPEGSRDPAYQVLTNQFAGQMVEAKRDLKVGNRADARLLIRNATNYCLSCHAQADRGLSLIQPVGTYLARLNPDEKVSFDFAFGRFQDGLKQYFAIIKRPGDLPPARLELLTLKAMSVAVRVEQDPKVAEQIAMDVTSAKWAPMHLQIGARRWVKSIKQWSQDKQKESLSKAKRLMAVAWNRRTRSPISRSGLIEALRASAILHDQLVHGPRGRQYAEALYLAGLSSEFLSDLEPAPLNEIYYTACIKQVPHTDIAKHCYLRLEGLALNENAGSGSRSLMALKKLAAPNEEAWLEWGKDRD